MEITKIPTDNLYKFIAISGLILFIIGLTFSVTYEYKTTKLKVENSHQKIDIKPVIAKKESIERKMQFLGEIAKKSNQINNLKCIDTTLTFKRLSNIKPLKYEYEQLIVELAIINNQIDKAKLKKDTNSKTNEIEEKKLKKDSIISYCAIGFGAVLLIIGFLLWYYKTQKILDKKLKNEATYSKLFEFRYQALKEINSVYFSIQPKKIWENMDEHEAYIDVSFSQSQINNLITIYINNHSAILDAEDLEKIKELERLSNEIKFEIKQEEYKVTSEGIELSKKIIAELKILCDNLKNKFDKEYK